MFLKLVMSLVHRWRLVLTVVIFVVFLLVIIQHNHLPLLSSLKYSDLTLHSSITELEDTGYKRRLPQAIIIGVRKAGTRALLDMLALHPDVVSAKAEVHYFDKNVNFEHGVQWYINAMPPSLSNQVVIEKTPAYFVGPIVPYRIFKTCPSVKLLLIVRNPVERTVSDYAQLNSKKRLSRPNKQVSFEKAVFTDGHVNTHYNPISVSMYDEHFSIWLEYFKLSQIHVVDGDALIRHPFTELRRVESFLGLQSYFTEKMFYFNETKGFYCWYRRGNDSYCLGSGKGREHPPVEAQSLSTLQEFFKPHNEQFFSQTGLRFNW